MANEGRGVTDDPRGLIFFIDHLSVASAAKLNAIEALIGIDVRVTADVPYVGLSQFHSEGAPRSKLVSSVFVETSTVTYRWRGFTRPPAS